jgi:hypothetical protein
MATDSTPSPGKRPEQLTGCPPEVFRSGTGPLYGGLAGDPPRAYQIYVIERNGTRLSGVLSRDCRKVLPVAR